MSFLDVKELKGRDDIFVANALNEALQLANIMRCGDVEESKAMKQNALEVAQQLEKAQTMEELRSWIDGVLENIPPIK